MAQSFFDDDENQVKNVWGLRMIERLLAMVEDDVIETDLIFESSVLKVKKVRKQYSGASVWNFFVKKEPIFTIVKRGNGDGYLLIATVEGVGLHCELGQDAGPSFEKALLIIRDYVRIVLTAMVDEIDFSGYSRYEKKDNITCTYLSMDIKTIEPLHYDRNIIVANGRERLLNVCKKVREVTHFVVTPLFNTWYVYTHADYDPYVVSSFNDAISAVSRYKSKNARELNDYSIEPKLQFDAILYQEHA